MASRPDRPTPRARERASDYPRPPALERERSPLRVEFAGVAVARSSNAWRVLETTHAPVYYFPPEDVRRDLLERAAGSSLCEWKGRAAYWTLDVDGRRSERAAWSYPEPTPAFAPIRDHFAFYASRVDACFVDGERATPQPGSFYGGWVTPAVEGPFKGAPGTEGW